MPSFIRYIVIISLSLLCATSVTAQQNNSSSSLRGRTIVAKGDQQFAPFEFINKKGEPDGFSVELFRELMKKLNLKYTLTLDDWGKVQEELRTKQIDLAIGMIYSNERAEKVKFGIPHCMISYNIICRKDNDFIKLEDLKGKDIIVQYKDRAHEYLLTSNLTNNIVTVEDISDGVKLLSSGKYDAVLSFDISSFYFVREGRYKNLVVHLTDILPERYSIVANTDNEELLYLLNAALYQMKIDGEYDKIYYKWFGVYEKAKVNRIVWYILAVLAFGLVVFGIFIRILRMKINESTRDLKAKNEKMIELVAKLREENLMRLAIEQNLIKAKDKAEESDRMKSAFLSNISHEIRTPLNAIIGFSSIICETEEAKEREKFFEIIIKNNELLLQLINDVLDLSKIESGIMIMNYTSFALGELCEQVVQSVASGFDQQEIKFVKKIDFDCTLNSDRARIIQVLMNFMTNAMKFTKQGSITLQTEQLDECRVKISVIDTGIGIQTEYLESVFERFVKLNSFSQGTGLGLSICKHIVDKLGGQIGVDSIPQKGSTFWIILPMSKP